jgi:hypothetical protein
MAISVLPSNAQPVGYEQLACDTAQSLTPPANARWAVFKAEAQIVRIRDDGTNPTTTVGFPLSVGAEPFVYTGRLKMVKAIAVAGGGLLNVLYYG